MHASQFLDEGFDPFGFGGPGHLGLCPEPVSAYSMGIGSIQELGFKMFALEALPNMAGQT